MPLKSSLRRKTAFVGVLGFAAALAAGSWGCSNNPVKYTDPNSLITTTHTANALIDAATLKQWADEGKVNNNGPATRDRVVIVTVGTPATYTTNHIPGAVLYNSSTEMSMTRLEGVAPITSMVADGPTMDAAIAKMGIDGNTTVVFTVSTGQNLLNMTRAYFTFRYWGFARERLKLLQGGDAAWVAAGNSLTTEVPVVRPSTFSVSNNYRGTTSNFALRTSIGEMIDVVDKVNTGSLSVSAAGGIAILDERGGVDPAVGPYMTNAGVDDWTQYYVSGQTSTFKPASDLVARLATFGVTATKSRTYVYCASGHRASCAFFILDGILGWPVSLYDGSSNQWLAYRTANNVGSAWRVDTATPGTTTLRTFGTISSGTLTLDPVANTTYTNVLDRRANQMLIEDKAYFTRATAGSPGTGGGGGGSPSGC